MEQQNEKLNLKKLFIEVTRRYNLKCCHCMKKESQNVNVTPQIIDSLFNQLNQVNTVEITGGEPFLAVNEIRHIIQEIIQNQIKILELIIITNGTVLDKTITTDLNLLGNYIEKYRKQIGFKYDRKPVIITISDDKYHPNIDREKAMGFYKRYCNDNVLIEYKYEEDRKREDFDENHLFYSGRAKNLQNVRYSIDGACHRVLHCMMSIGAHKGDIPLKGDFIQCSIYLSANGNIGLYCNYSYDDEDRDAMGNILEKPISKMIDCWQWVHPLECYEYWKKIEAQERIINNKNNPDYDSEEDNCIIKYTEDLEKYRISLHEELPHLTFDEIKKITTLSVNMALDKDSPQRKTEFDNNMVNMKLINYQRSLDEQYKSHEIGELFGLIAKAFQILQK